MHHTDKTAVLFTVLLVTACCETMAAETSVRRDLADSATSAWTLGAWNSAAGSVGWSDDRPAEAEAAEKSLDVSVRYSGKGFEFFGADVADAKIPGRCQRVSVWIKALKPGYSWLLKFQDADGKEQVDGHKLELDPKPEAGRWVRREFPVPTTWKQPIRLVGLAAHNWEHQREQAEAGLRLYDLRVTTDVGAVEDRRSLVRVRVQTDRERNVFLQGERVPYQIVCDSWLGRRLQGSCAYRVTDPGGAEVAAGKRDLAVDGARAEGLDLTPARFGAYRVAVEVSFDGGERFQDTSRFAYLPQPLEHTPEEKRSSPYGLNIHGGQPGVSYTAIARLGCVWIRDYAYNRQWLLRARGEDGRYAGWPWYPKMDRQIRDSGLMLLPCMGESIAPYVAASKLQPDQAWKRDLLHVLLAFPQYPAWELDNEYDYRHGRDEAKRDWSSYHAFHELFGRAVKFLDDRVWAVEQGTAGVHPDWVRRSIRSGAFDHIDVVNGHFYCGSRPPELCTENVNVGQEDAPPTLLFEALRDFVAAADCDQRDRQAWITEFGWDTLFGQIVTEEQQAAYLQRGFVLGLQSGLDKMFWYWDRDTKEQPKQFFDGCGLFDPREHPKPAAAALAGLTQRLKLPQPVGMFQCGPGTLGHLFRDRGRLVACVYRIDPDAPSAEVELPAGEAFDLYGNPLANRRPALGIAPVWIVGVSETDPAYLQTAYDLQSPLLVRVVAGDASTLQVRCRNQRGAPLRAQFQVATPERWTCEPPGGEFSVAAGAAQVVPVKVQVDPRQPAGTRQVDVKISEGPIQKTLTARLLVVPAAQLSTQPLTGPPGETTLVAELKNHASAARSFVLRADLPAGWKAEPAEQTLSDVPGGEMRQAKFRLTWNNRWQPAEVARVVAATPRGETVAQAGILPGSLRVPRVRGIRCDGDLKDWPAAARVPGWALGNRGLQPDSAAKNDAVGGEPPVSLYLGYAPEGLYFAVQVRGTRGQVTDPRSFWNQDCLEAMIDTRNNKQTRAAYAPTDHQFWFCPLLAEQRVYAGRWKRNDEIRETEYDLPGLTSACRRTDDGYIYEVLLPAARLQGYAAESGRKLGLNLNLTLPGEHGLREAYWPTSKADSAPTTPHRWGIVELDDSEP